MRVITSEGLAIYVYDDEHPPPHCHVIFTNGDELVVGLPFLEEWFGKKIKRQVRRVLEENLETIIDAWENKHPEKKAK